MRKKMWDEFIQDKFRFLFRERKEKKVLELDGVNTEIFRYVTKSSVLKQNDFFNLQGHWSQVVF